MKIRARLAPFGAAAGNLLTMVAAPAATSWAFTS